MAMLDKALITQRFTRAATTYDTEAHAQRQIAVHLAALLAAHLRPPVERALEIGCGTGLFTHELLTQFSPVELLLNDLTLPPTLATLVGEHSSHITFQQGDAEQLTFPTGQNLIATCSALQWFADPAAFIAKCRGLLAPDGILALSTFGPQNLHEVTTLTAAGLTYPSVAHLGAMLAPHFRILACEEAPITLRFPTPTDVLYHLKRTGVTAIGQQPWTKGKLHHFSETYRQMFSDGTSVTLTYQPIYIIAKTI